MDAVEAQNHLPQGEDKIFFLQEEGQDRHHPDDQCRGQEHAHHQDTAGMVEGGLAEAPAPEAEAAAKVEGKAIMVEI